MMMKTMILNVNGMGEIVVGQMLKLDFAKHANVWILNLNKGSDNQIKEKEPGSHWSAQQSENRSSNVKVQRVIYRKCKCFNRHNFEMCNQSPDLQRDKLGPETVETPDKVQG